MPNFSKNDIPYQVAYNAHSGTSFVPERRAKSEQNEYFGMLNSAYKELYDQAEKWDTLEVFEQQFERFEKTFKNKYLAYLNSRNGWVSTMIAGPSNFPARRMQKKGDSVQNKLNDLLSYYEYKKRKIYNKIKPAHLRPIKTGQDGALQALERKLKKRVDNQEHMKAVNKIVKSKKLTDEEKTQKLKEKFDFPSSYIKTLIEPDFMGRIGHPGYALSNNNAQIKRLKGRIAEEKRLAKNRDEGNKEYTFDGGKVVLNYDINRLQISHKEIPPVEVRQQLKKGGFRWSRKNKAWQRQLNTLGNHWNDWYVKPIVGEIKPVEKAQATQEEEVELTAEDKKAIADQVSAKLQEAENPKLGDLSAESKTLDKEPAEVEKPQESKEEAPQDKKIGQLTRSDLKEMMQRKYIYLEKLQKSFPQVFPQHIDKFKIEPASHSKLIKLSFLKWKEREFPDIEKFIEKAVGKTVKEMAMKNQFPIGGDYILFNIEEAGKIVSRIEKLIGEVKTEKPKRKLADDAKIIRAFVKNKWPRSFKNLRVRTISSGKFVSDHHVLIESTKNKGDAPLNRKIKDWFYDAFGRPDQHNNTVMAYGIIIYIGMVDKILKAIEKDQAQTVETTLKPVETTGQKTLSLRPGRFYRSNSKELIWIEKENEKFPGIFRGVQEKKDPGYIARSLFKFWDFKKNGEFLGPSKDEKFNLVEEVKEKEINIIPLWDAHNIIRGFIHKKWPQKSAGVQVKLVSEYNPIKPGYIHIFNDVAVIPEEIRRFFFVAFGNKTQALKSITSWSIILKGEYCFNVLWEVLKDTDFKSKYSIFDIRNFNPKKKKYENDYIDRPTLQPKGELIIDGKGKFVYDLDYPKAEKAINKYTIWSYQDYYGGFWQKLVHDNTKAAVLELLEKNQPNQSAQEKPQQTNTQAQTVQATQEALGKELIGIFKEISGQEFRANNLGNEIYLKAKNGRVKLGSSALINTFYRDERLGEWTNSTMSEMINDVKTWKKFVDYYNRKFRAKNYLNKRSIDFYKDVLNLMNKETGKTWFIYDVYTMEDPKETSLWLSNYERKIDPTDKGVLRRAFDNQHIDRPPGINNIDLKVKQWEIVLQWYQDIESNEKEQAQTVQATQGALKDDKTDLPEQFRPRPGDMPIKTMAGIIRYFIKNKWPQYDGVRVSSKNTEKSRLRKSLKIAKEIGNFPNLPDEVFEYFTTEEERKEENFNSYKNRRHLTFFYLRAQRAVKKVLSDSEYNGSFQVRDVENYDQNQVAKRVSKEVNENIKKMAVIEKPTQEDKTDCNRRMYIKEIHTDPARFQNREKLNQDIVKEIAENYDSNQFDPVVIWYDKKAGKWFLLAGHHRFEGVKKRGMKTVKSRCFEGTEAQAIKYAKELSNANRTLETPLERAKIYRKEIATGATKKRLEEKAQRLEGKNWNYILNLAHLKPTGKPLSALSALSANSDKSTQQNLEKLADWTGEARRMFASLDDQNETEMFEFLMDNFSGKKSITRKTDWIVKISAIVSRMDYKPGQVLNLKRIQGKTQGETEYQRQMATIDEKINKYEDQKKALKDRFNNPKAPGYVNPTAPDYEQMQARADQKIKDLDDVLRAVRKEKLNLMQKKGKMIQGGLDQFNLFAQAPARKVAQEVTKIRKAQNKPQKPGPDGDLSSLIDKVFKKRIEAKDTFQFKRENMKLIRQIMEEAKKDQVKFSTSQIMQIGIIIQPVLQGEKSIQRDNVRTHKRTLAPTLNNLLRWANDPGRYDLIGVDNSQNEKPTIVARKVKRARIFNILGLR